MARPRKTGLDYRPTDVSWRTDPKVMKLEMRHGRLGSAIWTDVIDMIYGNNGYYAIYDDDFATTIAWSARCDVEFVKEVIEYSVECDLFDENMYVIHRVLTSPAIQRNFAFATAKRVLDFRTMPYVIITVHGVSDAETLVSAVETHVSDAETLVSDVQSTQSIAKHSNSIVIDSLLTASHSDDEVIKRIISEWLSTAKFKPMVVTNEEATFAIYERMRQLITPNMMVHEKRFRKWLKEKGHIASFKFFCGDLLRNELYQFTVHRPEEQ